MATILGDVQYSQNGTFTNIPVSTKQNLNNINQRMDVHLSSTHPSDPMLVPRARHRPRSQVLLKKSAANRLVELFGEETLQDAQPLASRSSTGYTWLLYG